MYSDNTLKQISGQQNKTDIEQILNRLKSEMLIKHYEKDVNFPHPGYEYEKQYLVNYLITTIDNKYIVVDSSNSFRQDRIKQQYFNLEGVQKHSKIANDIVASIILFPNSARKASGFEKLQKEIEGKIRYAPVNQIYTFDEFVDFLEEVASDASSQNLMSEHDGSYYGKRGNELELEIVEILSDHKNLSDFREKNHSNQNIFDQIIAKICSDQKIAQNELIEINASNSVSKLRSGGSAKTDIIVELKTTEKLFIETVSLKRSDNNRVSCHDYQVEDFIRVLDCENTHLATYLNSFQKNPTLERFEGINGQGSIEKFSAALKSKRTRLIEWALKGEHDSKNLIDEQKQISRYLLLINKDLSRFVRFDDYIFKIDKFSGNFGTPFSWTYPSKQRGKRIQLKMPLVFH